MSKITAYHVNTRTGQAMPVRIENSLDEYYRLLDCRTIDIPSRKIGEHYYDIICDDEELLVNKPHIATMFDRYRNPLLFGSLLIVQHNEEGETISLTNAELTEISRCVSFYRYYDKDQKVHRQACLIGGY